MPQLSFVLYSARHHKAVINDGEVRVEREANHSNDDSYPTLFGGTAPVKLICNMMP